MGDAYSLRHDPVRCSSWGHQSSTMSTILAGRWKRNDAVRVVRGRCDKCSWSDPSLRIDCLSLEGGGHRFLRANLETALPNVRIRISEFYVCSPTLSIWTLYWIVQWCFQDHFEPLAFRLETVSVAISRLTSNLDRRRFAILIWRSFTRWLCTWLPF